MQALVLKIISICSRIAPAPTAAWMASMTRTPRIFPRQAWECSDSPLTWQGFVTPGIYGYRYGESDSVVVLAHGWEGRASQWSVLVDELVSVGAAVVVLDMPAHGKSKGRNADPASFSKAICDVLDAFEEVELLVGHSMGGSAVADALATLKVGIPSAILSTPFSMRTFLERTAASLGAGQRCTRSYIDTMEKRVGRPVDSLHLGRLSALHSFPMLVVHDLEDRVVPADDARRIRAAMGSAALHFTRGLGHRRILRDASVARRIVDFYQATKTNRSQRRCR